MHPFVLHFASGDALFSGALLVLMTLGLRWSAGFTRFPRSIRTLHCCGWIGIALSATPLPWWLYVAWGVIDVLAWRGGPNRSNEADPMRPARQCRPRWTVVMLLLSAGICGNELRTIRGDDRWTGPHKRIYVIGDSLSAGAGESAPPWPARLAAAGYPVTILARPGATTRSALEQAAMLPDDPQPALIIVEIGGNDLLPGRPAREFAADLERLLQTLQRPGRTLAVMELPLYPGANGYGAVQRRLCRETGASLISKRVPARALSGQGQTIDGLHLSAAGHQSLADWFAARLHESTPPRGGPGWRSQPGAASPHGGLGAR